MAKQTSQNLRDWALIGAEQRLLQIAQEAAEIHRAFPELRKSGSTLPVSRNATSSSAVPKRKRRKLSAEARKRISDAQKKRWAKQKAGK